MKEYKFPSILTSTVFSLAVALAAPYALAGDKDYDSNKQGMDDQQSEQMDREEEMRREREDATSPGAPNEMNTGPDGTGTGTSGSGTGNGTGTGGMGNDGAGTGAGAGTGTGAGGSAGGN